MRPLLNIRPLFFILFFILLLPQASGAEEKEPFWKKIQLSPILDVVTGFQADDSNTTPVPAGSSVLRGGLGEFRGNPGPSRNTFGFYLSELELDFSTDPESKIFFRADIDYSRDNGGNGGAGSINLEQGFVTIQTGFSRGLELTLGRVNDPTGIENEDRHENETIFYSWVNRATPNNVTGFRFSYPFTQRLTAQLLVINNFRDSITDDSPIPSFESVVTFHWGPEEKSHEWGLTFDAGPERPNDNQHWQYIADSYLRWPLTSHIRLDLEVLYSQINTAISGRKNSKAFGGYFLIHGDLSPLWSLYSRYGFFNDLNSAGEFTGTQQKIHQGTAGLGFQITDEVRTRLEYQVDLHQPSGGLDSFSHAVAFELIYTL
ncbi:MAG TPA: hypothetical protein DDW49_11390 [Deltaproteobacteria bacterium]|nr:MAG: hypothetical protein A2048_05600 [Deltaproteobacteria bacterium GWA2_45_12]HBF13970.1 hypothetical protein [Deltaproteobacteria bacterium]